MVDDKNVKFGKGDKGVDYLWKLPRHAIYRSIQRSIT